MWLKFDPCTAGSVLTDADKVIRLKRTYLKQKLILVARIRRRNHSITLPENSHGDKVLLSREGLQPFVLQKMILGPYEIIKSEGELNYHLALQV